MARNAPKNDDNPEHVGTGAIGSRDTIEARIACWMATGENETALETEIQRVLEEQARIISGRYDSKQIVRDATNALGDIMVRVQRSYDPERPFTPWLKDCLSNECKSRARAARTHRARLMMPMPEGLDTPDRAESQAATDSDSANTTATQLVHEIENRLKPRVRIIFTVAVGAKFAIRLGRDTIRQWCHDCDPRGDTLFETVTRIMDSARVHGRLEKLAQALNLRGPTARQIFKRARQRIMDHTESRELRAFLGLSRSERTRAARTRRGEA